MIYIYMRKFYGHSLRLQIYKKCEVNGEASKKRKKLAEKKAKRLAKDGETKEEPKEKKLDASKPITLDFLTNPDKK